ncbi:hypothetical protein NUSPORA_01143 [Nucleospora cyclopteri]
MGAVVSLPSKPLEIAKTNKNMPMLHRTFNIEDHLFEFKLKPQVKNDKYKLKLHLEEFSNNIKYYLRKISLNALNITDLERYRELINKEYALYKYLQNDPNTKEISIDSQSNDRHIYMCRHYITELNENIGLLNHALVIQACCNYITRIPSSIKHLKNLKMLILSRNRIREIPREIGMCRELKELDLSNNLIEEIPTSLAALKSLTSLHLSHNKIRELPPCLGKMSSLKNIYINDNLLEYLPLELLKLPFLTSIFADKNRFIEIVENEMEIVGETTLTEICARKIINENIKIPKIPSKHVREYIMSVKECSFCGGPFFNNYVEVSDVHDFDNRQYPIKYQMCRMHYKSHSQRISVLFSGEHEATMPAKLIADKMPNITELFDPFCHSNEESSFIEIEYDKNILTVPLICLSLWNDNSFAKHTNDRKRSIEDNRRSKKRTKTFYK